MHRKLVLIVMLIALATQFGQTFEPAQAAPQSASPGSGPIGTPFRITDASNDQVRPAIAYNSQNQEYLVVYQSEWSGGKNIAGQRVSASGALAGSVFNIYGGTSGYSADVAYNSQANEYLVVWEHDDGVIKDVHGRRVSATGTLLGSELTIITAGMSGQEFIDPAVGYASTENKYLVAFTHHYTASPFWYAIWGISLNSDGSTNGSDFPIGGDIAHSGNPDLAYNYRRNEFLVAYETYGGGHKQVYARRVTMAGGTPTAMATELPVGTFTSDQTAPSVAVVTRSPDGQYLVAWESKLPTSIRIIWEAWISGTGTAEGILSLGSGGQDESSPAVAGNEKAGQYLLAWTRPFLNGSFVFNDIDRAILPSSLSNPLGKRAGVGSLFADHAAVAGGPSGDFLVAYEDISTGRDIFGQLWGNRFYLPLTRR